ncbi:MAG: endolytic transglycosylase MltG [Ruminococcaceae bacterium]|nr:endolytic transglycosylase MltG [Oscillospiraceae bacterium]
MKRKKSIGFKVLMMILVLLLIVFGWYISSVISDYKGNPGDKLVTVTIEEGSGTAEIAEVLKENGVIKYPFWFRLASKKNGYDGQFQQGSFVFSQKAGYETVFKGLMNPENVLVRVTIPEGFELRQIADRLEEQGLIDRERFFKVAEKTEFDYWFLKDLPKRENRLEGYLFPDTYMFKKGDTEENIINTMLSRFDQIYMEEYRKRAKALSMTDDEIIILASVIEREAMGDEDRDKVASVFHNRLKNKQYPYLESCATVQYILKERKAVLSVADTKIDSPYNTYRNPGLPVGPIASPGKAAIEAALYPAETEYLFFVLDSTGVHRFAKTYEEHQQNMKK